MQNSNFNFFVDNFQSFRWVIPLDSCPSYIRLTEQSYMQNEVDIHHLIEEEICRTNYFVCVSNAETSCKELFLPVLTF